MPGKIANPVKTYGKCFAEEITLNQENATQLSEYVFNGIRLMLVNRIMEVALSGYSSEVGGKNKNQILFMQVI